MSTTVFEKKYTITTNMGDKNDDLLVTSVLDIFQDAAGKHAEIISDDPKKMLERGFIWVLVRNRAEIINKPKINKDVYLRTYQSVVGPASYEREYFLYNEDNELIAKGESKWCIIDINSGKIVPTSNFSNTNEVLNQKAFIFPFNRIRSIENIDFAIEYKVQYTDLDHNNHFNNTKYVIPIINNFGRNVRYIEMNFLKQAYLNDDLVYKYQKIDNDKFYVFMYKKEELINKCYIELA